MSPELHQRVRKLFDEAVEKPESQRLPFLRAACTDDLEAYQAVVRLLEAHTAAPSFLEDHARRIERIGRYLVTGELGRGAMGVVYEAIDPLIGRSVAVKIIHFQSLADANEAEFMRDRLFREARAAGRLFHPGIVVILDVGQEGGIAFIAMERVDGPPLEKMLASGRRLRLTDSLDILRQTAAALDYAHQNGVVHRDVKPGNILLHKGTAVKVSDFGIAKSMSTQHGTIAGLMLGTPSYMSPEQIEALSVDGRSDQFSLAVVAYELLSGNRPFQGDSLAMLAHTVVYGDRPSIRTTNPALPAELDEVLHRGLARSPERRYESCTKFIAALDEKLRHLQDAEFAEQPQLGLPRQELLGPDSRRIAKKRPVSLGYLAVVGGALVVLALILSYYRAAFYRSPSASRIDMVTKLPPAEGSAAPVVKRFVVVPELIEAGSSATLRWDVTGATEVLIDQGIGKVKPSGTLDIKPRMPTVYVLTANGPGGSIPAQARIDVTSHQIDNQALARRLYDAAVDKRRTAQYKEAVELFRQAAGLGEPRAMQELGDMFMEGDGVAKDDTEAVKWFRKGADSGNTSAITFLGAMYLLGTGVEQSDTDAANWFRKAADAGNPAAIFDLGTLYETGRGVTKDLAIAKRLYEKAASLGNEEAQKRLKQLR